jgi:uncharacterized membrane protein YkvA (DUF1232 family)
MIRRGRFLKRLLLDLPRNLKLAYCLAVDPRMPARNKAALAAALGLIVTPYVNLPAWIPVVGQMDVLALSLLATRLFIGSAPAEVVAEHEALIRQRRSRFDQDVESGRRFAVALSRRLPAEEPSAGTEPAPPAATSLPGTAQPVAGRRSWSWEADRPGPAPADRRTTGVTR